jgi:hypothetical protein
MNKDARRMGYLCSRVDPVSSNRAAGERNAYLFSAKTIHPGPNACDVKA